MLKYSVFACVAGFLLDIIIGDPNWSYHPIRLIGKLIDMTEKLLRKLFSNRKSSIKAAGFLLVIIVCAIFTAIALAVNMAAYGINLYFGLFIDSIICCFMLSAKSLKKESMKVYYRLKGGDVESARSAVSMIVGRDTQSLDEKGIIKAAVETVAENLSDGVIAPIFYMLIGGSTLGVLYKAINTMDSMVGYKNERYINFGYFAAKLDDIANFIPSRLSALMLIAASFICRKDYKNAIKIFKRDRLKHASPNSAQTEAVCAGALRIQLAGNAYYFGKLYKKEFIGDPIEEVDVENIAEINSMMYCASILSLLVFGAIRLLFFSMEVGFI